MKKLILFSSIVSVVLLFACKKTQFIDFTPTEGTRSEDLCSDTLTIEDIEEIGELHNLYVQEAFENYDFNTTDVEGELREQFLGLTVGTGLTQLGTQTKDSIFTLAISGYHYSEYSEYPEYISDTALVNEYYSRIEEAIDTFETIEHLDSLLDVIQGNVIANLECKDKELLLICIEVARQSAMLWTPVELGGEGFLNDYLFPNQRADWRKKLGRIIAGDTAGAATVFMEIGIGLLIPGSNAAIAGAIAFGAGAASAWTAANCC